MEQSFHHVGHSLPVPAHVSFANQINIQFSFSEDGFYTTYADAPEEGGEWIVEAMSMSPFHGLRLAQPQKILRTKPIEVGINGLAASIRRGEILSNVNVVTRNNMPIPLQVQR